MELNANIQLLMNSFRTLFPDKIFSLTVNIIPDMFQIPWHFQVFQTSGHPELWLFLRFAVSPPGWFTFWFVCPLANSPP